MGLRTAFAIPFAVDFFTSILGVGRPPKNFGGGEYTPHVFRKSVEDVDSMWDGSLWEMGVWKVLMGKDLQACESGWKWANVCKVVTG